MIDIIKKNLLLVFILLSIFFVALFLRTVSLSTYPVGFQIDEAILGYTGYSLIHTMKDTGGVFLPMYTEVFGDYIPTGYHFLTVPSILVFGLTEFATRLPGAVFGALTVFPMFFLSYALFRKKSVSVLSALFIAISPWNLILSRGSSEAGVSVFFVLFGFAFLIESLRNLKIKYLLFAGLFLAVSFFFYHTPRVFVPLMLIATYLYMLPAFKNMKSGRYKQALTAMVIVVIGIVFVLTVSFKGTTARFNQISIFSFPETRLVMEEQLREDGVSNIPPLVARVFHNKIINSTFTFTKNYSEYLSIDTLFMRPGLPIIFAIPNVGLIFIVFLPFFFYGLARLVVKKDRIAKLAILWILIAPITAALTVDDVPNMRRASVLFPVIEMVSIYGLVSFVSLFNTFHTRIKYAVIIILIFSFSWNFLYFEHQYFIHGEKHRPWYRNNGFSQMMKLVNKNYKNYDTIVTTKSNGGFPLFLFYSTYNPEVYQKEGSPKDKDYKGFGKFIFVPNDCPSGSPTLIFPLGTKVMYIDRGTCVLPSKKYRKKYTDILREDGTPVFRVVF